MILNERDSLLGKIGALFGAGFRIAALGLKQQLQQPCVSAHGDREMTDMFILQIPDLIGEIERPKTILYAVSLFSRWPDRIRLGGNEEDRTVNVFHRDDRFIRYVFSRIIRKDVELPIRA